MCKPCALGKPSGEQVTLVHDFIVEFASGCISLEFFRCFQPVGKLVELTGRKPEPQVIPLFE